MLGHFKVGGIGISNTRLLKLVDTLNQDAQLYKLFRFNELTQNIELIEHNLWPYSKHLSDTDLIQLKFYISKVHHDEYTTNLIKEAITIVSQRISYNPLKNYLNDIVWDNKPRLAFWLSEICGAEQNAYTEEMGTKILCAAVKRIFEPGCKFDYMLILEGSQGIGKSTLVDILGGEYYLDTSLSSSENKKDIVDAMRTAWIIEISDLAGFRKSDVEYLKNFLSDKSDRVRMPYAIMSKDYPRQCVFIGTHNPSGDNQYFKDDTGNRRFWTLECKDIDLKKMKEWRDQLFAEAVVKYNGMALCLENPLSLSILSAMHKSREIETPLNAMIAEYINLKNNVSNHEIIESVFKQNVGHLSFTELRSRCTIIGIYMKKAGWIKGENKHRGWYFRPGYEFESIEGWG